MFLFFLHLFADFNLIGPTAVKGIGYLEDRTWSQYHCDQFPLRTSLTPARQAQGDGDASPQPRRPDDMSLSPRRQMPRDSSRVLALVTPNQKDQEAEKNSARQYMETLSKACRFKKADAATDIGAGFFIVATSGNNLFRIKVTGDQGKEVYFKLLVNNTKTDAERNAFMLTLLKSYLTTFNDGSSNDTVIGRINSTLGEVKPSTIRSSEQADRGAVMAAPKPNNVKQDATPPSWLKRTTLFFWNHPYRNPILVATGGVVLGILALIPKISKTFWH